MPKRQDRHTKQPQPDELTSVRTRGIEGWQVRPNSEEKIDRIPSRQHQPDSPPSSPPAFNYGNGGHRKEVADGHPSCGGRSTEALPPYDGRCEALAFKKGEWSRCTRPARLVCGGILICTLHDQMGLAAWPDPTAALFRFGDAWTSIFPRTGPRHPRRYPDLRGQHVRVTPRIADTLPIRYFDGRCEACGRNGFRCRRPATAVRSERAVCRWHDTPIEVVAWDRDASAFRFGSSSIMKVPIPEW